jgi:LPXTG-motif cell wall-anchored protein
VAEGSFGTVPADSGAGDDTGLAAVAGLGGLSLLAGSAAVVAYRRNRG